MLAACACLEKLSAGKTRCLRESSGQSRSRLRGDIRRRGLSGRRPLATRGSCTNPRTGSSGRLTGRLRDVEKRNHERTRRPRLLRVEELCTAAALWSFNEPEESKGTSASWRMLIEGSVSAVLIHYRLLSAARSRRRASSRDYGTMGSGKTTMLGEASDVLTARGIANAAVDLDTFGMGHMPEPAWADLPYRNLSLVWQNYAAAGAPANRRGCRKRQRAQPHPRGGPWRSNCRLPVDGTVGHHARACLAAGTRNVPRRVR